MFINKKDSSLTRQKIIKRKNFYRQKSTQVKKTVYFTISFLLIIIFFYFNKHYPNFVKKNFLSQTVSKDWEVFVSSNLVQKQENDKLLDIIKTIETTTEKGDTINWSLLAKKIQKDSLFSQVTITNSLPKKNIRFLKRKISDHVYID